MISRWNALQTWLGAQAMEASALVRRAMIRADDRRRSHRSTNSSTTKEPAATGSAPPCSGTITRRAPAAWAGQDDPLAVTDASARVYGVEGLRVADASIMPRVPCANTNMPTIMIGEKVAATVLAEE